MRLFTSLVAVLICACGASSGGTSGTPPPSGGPCPVTTAPPAAVTSPPTAGTGPNPSLAFRAGPDAFLYGNDALVVVLPNDATLHPDQPNAGMPISVKFGWWRSIAGVLIVETRRVDASTAPLAAIAPSGYGDRGFQVSGLQFPSAGCWRVTGSVAGRSLDFVVNVSAR